MHIASTILLAYLAGGTFALLMMTSRDVAKIIPTVNTNIMIANIELVAINMTSL